MLISLVLRVTGDNLEPDIVTKALGVSPYASRRRGDTKVLKSGNKVIAKFGTWEWQSNDHSESLSIAEHLRLMQTQFGDRLSAVTGLSGVENAWIDIHIVDGDKHKAVSNVSFVFDAAALSFLNRAGLPVEVTVDILPPAGVN